MEGTDAPQRAASNRATKPAAKPNIALLKARMRKELSVEELAGLTGMSGKQIRLIENGEVKWPHMNSQRSLAAALDENREQLFPLGRRPRPKRKPKTEVEPRELA